MQDGTVISLNYNNTKKPKALKQSTNHNGYVVVAIIDKDGYKAPVRVHRLVAMAYIDMVAGKDFVNHIDGDKTNNSVSNLEWCTPKENYDHAVTTGLYDPALGVRKVGEFVGEKAGNAKLNDAKVMELRNRYALGESPTEMAKEFNVTLGTVECLLYKGSANATWTHLEYPEVIVKAVDKHKKAVVQMSKDCTVIAEFSGMREAMKATGVDRSDIGRVCKGKGKTAGGFKWKFKTT